MARGALYNRWRSQTFADILGQEHITRTLQNQIRAGRIAHAYLFTGLRGTGKTSTARIMAKAVNCIGDTDTPPCNKCRVCRSITEGRSTDLFEIDGASNRGIDEIRALRENVAFAPSEGRYKVYVIDEVHMLTHEAFNALLKTLEEPPPHVIFILCTTEPHRLPDTVLSRCQRFDFRRGSVSAISTKLQRICEQEGIAISERALAMIARRATGSFRDAESLLDQLSSYGTEEITEAQVQAVLGTVETDLILSLVTALVQADVGAGLADIAAAMDRGAEPRQLLSEVVDALRALMLILAGRGDDAIGLSEQDRARLGELVASEAADLAYVVGSLRRFSEAASRIRMASRPELPIELAFVESVLARDAGKVGGGQSGTPVEATRSVGRAGPRPAPKQKPPSSRAGTKRSVATSGSGGLPMREPKQGRSYASRPSAPKASARVAERGSAPAQVEDAPEWTLEWVQGNWGRVLSKANAHDPQVGALLRSAVPVSVRGQRVTIGCSGEFNRKQLSDDKKRRYVEGLLGDVLGGDCHIECVTDPAAVARFVPGSPAGDPSSGPGNGSLFAKSAGKPEASASLRNHPTVKELERRGGVVQEVHVVAHGGTEE
ncbi:MAG: DNA polymerase III subunit gamma/tau [Anaerolineae bacterium]